MLGKFWQLQKMQSATRIPSDLHLLNDWEGGCSVNGRNNTDWGTNKTYIALMPIQ